MSNIDTLIDRATGLQRPNEWRPQAFAVSFEEEKTGKIEPRGFATQEQYVLELRVQSMYWANQAERTDARKYAEACIVQLLYDDALLPLRRLRQAVMEGDREQAFKWCNRLESVLTGVSP